MEIPKKEYKTDTAVVTKIREWMQKRVYSNEDAFQALLLAVSRGG